MKTGDRLNENLSQETNYMYNPGTSDVNEKCNIFSTATVIIHKALV